MKKGLLLGETDLCNGDHTVLQVHVENPGLGFSKKFKTDSAQRSSNKCKNNLLKT